jgi:YVTN family beta-propeller protein
LVYCANHSGANVTVIDGSMDTVLKTIAVDSYPRALVFNPAQSRVYVANSKPGSSNISVIRDSTLGVAERATLTARHLSLEACPNPFSGQTRLLLTANGLRPVVRIYDVNGALVRDLNLARSTRVGTEVCPYDLIWDGTDGMGRRLPTGVYVVRLSDGTGSVNRKVMLLR